MHELKKKNEKMNVHKVQGHHNVIYLSAPMHATLAQPAAGADALKDLRAHRAPRKFSHASARPGIF